MTKSPLTLAKADHSFPSVIGAVRSVDHNQDIEDQTNQKKDAARQRKNDHQSTMNSLTPVVV